MRVRCRCSVFLPRVFLRFSRIQASRSLTESQPTQSLMRCSVMAPIVGEQALESKCALAGAPPDCAGRRDAAGACLAAADDGADGGVEPVVSGGNCGSAFMIVTGGIDAADGKNNPLRGADAAGGCASPSPAPALVAATTGDFAPAGQAAAWRST